MEIFQTAIAQMYIVAFAIGFVSGAVYTIVSVFICRGRTVPEHISDFAITLLCGISIIIVSYNFYNGQIRFEVILSVLAGYLIYYTVFGRITERFLTKIRKYTDRLFALIIKPITVPIGAIIKRIKKFADSCEQKKEARRKELESRRSCMNSTEEQNDGQEPEPRLRW